MADIFLSYAREDQAFAHVLAGALESEGFLVRWDRTIPPGQAWDKFIADGIAEARCCVVIWSKDSAESDWVKEEATLAKEAGKLLPVQISGDQPPIGFRRMQAANLRDWKGDTEDPQWRMLVAEVRGAVSGEPVRHAQQRPRSGVRVGVFAALFVVAAVIAGVVFLVNDQSGRRETAAMSEPAMASEQAPTEAAAPSEEADETAILPAPISPPDGALMHHFPRRTVLRWRAAPEATGYEIEVQYWIRTSETWRTQNIYQSEEPQVAFEFIGATRGRWRVLALQTDGAAGAWSEWRTFAYTR